MKIGRMNENGDDFVHILPQLRYFGTKAFPKLCKPVLSTNTTFVALTFKILSNYQRLDVYWAETKMKIETSRVCPLIFEVATVLVFECKVKVMLGWALIQ